MSNEGHGHGPSWYKLFVIVVGAFYGLLLFMVSQCTFSAQNPESLFNSALCVVYGALAAFAFILANFISLIGLEQAKRKNKKPGFYYLSIIIFFAAALATLAYKLT